MRFGRALIFAWLGLYGCRAGGGGDSFDAMVRRLDTPDKLAAWINKRITFVSKFGAFSGPQQIEETFRTKRGNCADVAMLVFHVLAAHRYEPHIMAIQVASDVQKNHALCAFFQNGRLYSINNGTLLGPYAGFEAIAADHHRDWSEYRVYDSLEAFSITHIPAVSKRRAGGVEANPAIP